MTIAKTAREIAAYYVGEPSNIDDLERDILRHMERHIALTRKATFDKLMEAANVYNDRAVIRAFLRQEMKQPKTGS